MLATTANQLTGRAIGALFLAAFGSAWLAFGFAAIQRLHPATATLVGLGLLALVLTGSWVLRHAKRLPAPAPDLANTRREQRERRVFGVVNAVQWGAIFFAGWLLPRLGLTAYFMPAIAAIVGLHFFPLARLFHYPVHYVTGGALLVCVLGCLLLLPRPEWQACVALGAGIILWLSASYSLVQAVRVLRNRQPANALEQSPLTS